MAGAYRIEVMHGVNLNMLGRRDPAQYGTLTLMQLEQHISEYAAELDLEVRFLQTNAESEFVEHLQGLAELADGIVLNPGAWTHYSWAIRDALEIAALPAVEVHLSNVKAREEWRRFSVVEELCVASICGKGAEGYREALEVLRGTLQERTA
ncbi:MAG TPA: type II 3-dehydroquinate dehydratase [Solirubrobacteraceae bacterium]|jgi:3-dehydroquinate dehydratase-2